MTDNTVSDTPPSLPDLLLAFAGGAGVLRAPEFAVFFRSAQAALPPTVEKVVYTSLDTAAADVAAVEQFGFAVCRTGQVKGNYLCDRWKVFHDDLCRSRGHYRYVCLTDSRDVLFQADPLPLLAERLHARGCQALVFAEGMVHQQCAWNSDDQRAFQRDCGPWQTPFAQWPVANGGAVLGELEAVRRLCLLLCVAALPTAGRCTDQAVLNYLLNVPLRDDAAYRVDGPLDSALVVTGQGVKEGHVTIAFDGQARDSRSEEPYRLVHQWDRTPYRQAILGRYVGSVLSATFPKYI